MEKKINTLKDPLCKEEWEKVKDYYDQPFCNLIENK